MLALSPGENPDTGESQPPIMLKHGVKAHVLSAEDRRKGGQTMARRRAEAREQAAEARRTALEAARDRLEDGEACMRPFDLAIAGEGEPQRVELGMRAVERLFSLTGQAEQEGEQAAWLSVLRLNQADRASLRVELTERKLTIEGSSDVTKSPDAPLDA